MKAQLYNSVNLFLQTRNICIVSSLPFVKGVNQDFKRDVLMGGIFSEISVGRIKSEDSIFCGSSVRELVNVGQFFFNQ